MISVRISKFDRHTYRTETLGRSRRRWEDSIRMELEEIGINAGNWVDSTQDRNYWSPCECGIEPPGFHKPRS